MSDTMRAVRAAVARHRARVGGFPMPARRYAPRSWFPVHPWGYYAGPHRRPRHTASIGPTGAGKTPAAALTFRHAGGKLLATHRQP